MFWRAGVRATGFCPDSSRRLLLLAPGLVVLLTLVSAVASAQPVDLAANLGPAQEALAAGDYDDAYKQYRRVAEDENNPLAQYSVGLFYQLGWGRPVDDAEACRWFAQAAEGNIPGALLAHADCLRYGMNGEASPKEAARYYTKAADEGLPTALCSLAELHMAGEGVPHDPAKALDLCTAVARQGYPAAINTTGLFYLEGDESIRDNEKALQWFVAGANANDPAAMYNLGRMMRLQLVADTDMDDARQWFEKAAAQGYEPAYFRTAELYYLAEGQGENGTITEDHLAKLYMWLQVTLQASTDQAERDEAAEMLEQVLVVMPEAWRPTLDQRVTEHLQKFDRDS
jgi:TPR repeat protein